MVAGCMKINHEIRRPIDWAKQLPFQIDHALSSGKIRRSQGFFELRGS